MQKAQLQSKVKDEMRKHRWGAVSLLVAKHQALVDDDYELTWNFGWTLFSEKKFHLAEMVFQKAVALDPNNSTAYFGIGMSQLKQELFPDAIESLTRSLGLKDYQLARQSLALAYMKEGDLKKAEAVHREGLELKPQSYQRWKHYSDFLSDIGRDQDSQEALKRSRELRVH